MLHLRYHGKTSGAHGSVFPLQLALWLGAPAASLCHRLWQSHSATPDDSRRILAAANGAAAAALAECHPAVLDASVTPADKLALLPPCLHTAACDAAAACSGTAVLHLVLNSPQSPTVLTAAAAALRSAYKVQFVKVTLQADLAAAASTPLREFLAHCASAGKPFRTFECTHRAKGDAGLMCAADTAALADAVMLAAHDITHLPGMEGSVCSLTGLQQLEMSSTSNPLQAQVSALTRLTALTIEHVGCCTSLGDVLRPLKQLRRLSLHGMPPERFNQSAAVAAALTGLALLTHLTLESEGKSEGLNTLEISEVLGSISALSELRELAVLGGISNQWWFDGNSALCSQNRNAGAALARGISALPHMCQLWVRNAQSACMHHLVGVQRRLASLQDLQLICCNFTTNWAQALTAITSLRSLIHVQLLAFEPDSQAAVRNLTAVMARNPFLTHVRLGVNWSEVSDGAMARAAAALATLLHLEILDMADTESGSAMDLAAVHVFVRAHAAPAQAPGHPVVRSAAMHGGSDAAATLRGTCCSQSCHACGTRKQ